MPADRRGFGQDRLKKAGLGDRAGGSTACVTVTTIVVDKDQRVDRERANSASSPLLHGAADTTDLGRVCYERHSLASPHVAGTLALAFPLLVLLSSMAALIRIRRRCNVSRSRAAALSFCADADAVPFLLCAGAGAGYSLDRRTRRSSLSRHLLSGYNSSFHLPELLSTSVLRLHTIAATQTMIARSSVILAAIAALVSAQTPPSCASSCITNSMSSSGCQSANIQCLCTSQSYIDAVTSCVESSCASSDFGAALSYAQSLCAGAGVTLSIDTATLSAAAEASDASSGSASTSTEVSTTASESASAAASSTASSATESSSASSAAAASSSASSSGAESSSTLATSTTSGSTSSSSAASTTTSAASTSTAAAAAKFDPISVSFACIGAVVVSFIAGVASFGF
ncbi:hypothetical protein V1523DRAFT_449046 [Lipomyces doorenjongii]